MNQIGDKNSTKYELSQDRSSKMQKISRAVGLVLIVVSIFYFVSIIIRYADSLPSISWGASTILTLGAASFVYMSVIVIGVLVWNILLRGVGIDAGILEAGTIFAVSQFSKYIPGNIAQHLSRLAISTARGWNAAKVLLTMVIEASWAVLASAFIAGLVLFIIGDSVYGWFEGLPSIWQLLLLAISVLMLVVIAFLAMRFVLPAFFPDLSDLRKMELPSISILIICYLLNLLSYMLMGLVVHTLAVGLFGETSASFWLLTGIFAVAWVTGFLTPGAPAGLGVREAVLIAGLAPVYGSGAALGITVSVRLVTTITDGIAFLIGLAAGRVLQISTRPVGEPESHSPSPG